MSDLAAYASEFPWLNPMLFTTQWGLLYLVVLAVLMLPALLFPSKRWLAASMFLLFICDRVAVGLLPPDLALFFLAFAYFLVTVAVVLTHQRLAAKIVGVALLITSIAFIAGGFEIIDWDIAGSIQEACGLVAMLAIIFRHQNGRHVHAGAIDALALDRRRDLASGLGVRSSSRRQDRK